MPPTASAFSSPRPNWMYDELCGRFTLKWNHYIYHTPLVSLSCPLYRPCFPWKTFQRRRFSFSVTKLTRRVPCPKVNRVIAMFQDFVTRVTGIIDTNRGAACASRSLPDNGQGQGCAEGCPADRGVHVFGGHASGLRRW